MSAPYEQPPPPGASRFRRWLSRAGGSHPDQPERELREEPAKPQWRWTIAWGTLWSLGIAAFAPWVGLLVFAVVLTAAAGELWAWERAGAEGPGWRPLDVGFWTVVVGSAVALETLTDQSFALAMAAVAPFSTAVPQIGRGIRAAKDGAPRPSERLVDEGPANDVAPAAPRPPTPPAG
ncbi:hypothetical protein AB0L40_24550 [Patulibacter sp. NPDC049589]|uniref:hypothetical protein n=1 Tax=Patulibacter sp. NPDC049589 TaxID=3154731 RepID=UPI0034296C17